MTQHKQVQIEKNLDDKIITVVREFAAPPPQVWKAWTESDLLDQWWAPRPWKANTKSMDFREGGRWLYSMTGPDNTASWSRSDFHEIVDGTSFTAETCFCDEEGNRNAELPAMHWNCKFAPTSTGTQVTVDITFTDRADLEKIVAMGFETGFASGMNNLDELLAQ